MWVMLLLLCHVHVHVDVRLLSISHVWLAVEKGKYETIEEGIKQAVKVYIKALEEQTKQRQLTVTSHTPST